MIRMLESAVVMVLMPILLIPIEWLFPWPYIIEEVVKYLVVERMVNSLEIKLQGWMCVVGSGLLFAFSETLLYMTTIIEIGRPKILADRLIMTGVLHGGTMLLMYLGIRKSRGWGLVMLVVAILAHYWYNKLTFGLIRIEN